MHISNIHRTSDHRLTTAWISALYSNQLIREKLIETFKSNFKYFLIRGLNQSPIRVFRNNPCDAAHSFDFSMPSADTAFAN
jgi:hypothetical protein